MDTEDLTSRVEEWSSQIQEEIDTNKATIEAVNTFIVVHLSQAFRPRSLPDVNLPHSAMHRAANLFAFLGLIFEIAGTFLGALHSVLLQRRSQNKSLSLQRVTLFKADLKTILKWYTRKKLNEKQETLNENEDGRVQAAKHPQNGPSHSMFDHIENIAFYDSNIHFEVKEAAKLPETGDDWEDRKERFQRVELFFQEIQRHPLSSSQGHIIDMVNVIFQELNLRRTTNFAPELERHVPYRQSTQHILNIVPPVMRPMFTFGNMPLISMAIGVTFLAVSTILLAATSQVVATEVWISCTGVLVVVMVFSVLPFSPWLIKEIRGHFGLKLGRSLTA